METYCAHVLGADGVIQTACGLPAENNANAVRCQCGALIAHEVFTRDKQDGWREVISARAYFACMARSPHQGAVMVASRHFEPFADLRRGLFAILKTEG